MRYKRNNTLALDVSSVPRDHRLAVVQPLLKFLKLDPAKLKSVQVHSTRKTIFVGLPDDRSAAAIATKTPRYSITIDGTKHYIPLEFVDEDVVEVRVRDLPPETPTDVIQHALRQFGQVLSVLPEVWRDFFPGVPTGVKLARMKIVQNIPVYLTIGNSKAFICYDGQPRNNSPSNAAQSSKADEINEPLEQGTQQQQQQQKQAHDENNAVVVATQKQHQQKRQKIDPPIDTGDPSSSDFTVVRRKGKQTQQVQQQQSTPQNQPPPGPSAFDWHKVLVNLNTSGQELYREEEEKRRNNSNNNNIK